MAQVVSTNYLVHDGKGKPQVIKVIQTPNAKQTTPQTPIQVRAASSIIKSIGSSKELYSNDEQSVDGDVFRSPAQTNSPGIVRRADLGGHKVVRVSPRDLETIYSEKKSPRASNGKRISPEPSDWSSGSGGMTRRRKSEKLGKGLRHFSMKVCEKVREKGHTTYNEVADELVDEFTSSPSFRGDFNYDQKNIRRRVYDALNVLMAMNIISKEKKDIRWLGLPSSLVADRRDSRTARERVARLRRQISVHQERIAAKKRRLFALITQQVAFKNLVARNRSVEAVRGVPEEYNSIRLPLLIVSTNQNTIVNVSVSNDRREYHFSFDDGFEINDESHVLEGLGLMMGLQNGQATEEDFIKAKALIPKALVPYLEEMVYGDKSIRVFDGESPSTSSQLLSPLSKSKQQDSSRAPSPMSTQIEMLEDEDEESLGGQRLGSGGRIIGGIRYEEEEDDGSETASDSEMH